MAYRGGYPGGGGRGEGFRAAFRRIFGDSENIFSWALPVARVAGISVRIHLFFIVFVVAMLLASLNQGAAGVGYRALMLSTLFFIVLLHEFGHCFACRWSGGEADEIVLWPLGGLAMCAPAPGWKPYLITVVGGPMVNVLLIPVTSLGMAAIGRSDFIVFNPFEPYAFSETAASWGHNAVFFAHYINFILLAFNVLLPMFPLDGGRMLEGVLWARMGRLRGSQLALKIGVVCACVVGVWAIAVEKTMLLGIAAFAGISCWVEWQRLRATEDLGRYESGGNWRPYAEEEARTHAGPSKRELKRQRQEAALNREVDRILAKIKNEGMGSLTRKEKHVLQQDTQRKRGAG